MDNQFYSVQAAIAKAGYIKTSLVTSKVRFFDSALLTPTQFTTRDQLMAAQCTFSGYTAGGYALAAWTGPANTPGGGQTLTSPLVNVVFDGTADPPVPNAVGGFWIEDDTMTTPQVRLIGTYDPVRTMGQDGDVITWVQQIVEGKNPTV